MEGKTVWIDTAGRLANSHPLSRFRKIRVLVLAIAGGGSSFAFVGNTKGEVMYVDLQGAKMVTNHRQQVEDDWV